MKLDGKNLDLGLRTCSGCKLAKPATLEYFYARKTGRAKLSSQCKDCVSARDREYRLKKPTILAAPPGATQICKVCRVAKPATVDYYRSSAFCRFGIRKTCKDCDFKESVKGRTHSFSSEELKERHLKYAYGMTVEEYERMNTAQGGRCAICKSLPEKLHVDHCHSSGEIRSLLCGPCNRALGIVRESTEVLQAMIAYLELHKETPNAARR